MKCKKCSKNETCKTNIIMKPFCKEKEYLECDPTCVWINKEDNSCNKRHREELTCENIGEGNNFKCSNCKTFVDGWKMANYCISCGRKVVKKKR